MTNTKTNFPKLRFPEFRDEWQLRKLSELVSYEPRPVLKPKNNYLALGLRSHFKGVFHRPESEPDKNAMEELFLVKKDDLIVNITFAWEGAVAIAGDKDEGGYVSHRFPTFIFRDNLKADFFRFLFPNKRFTYQLGLASPGGAGRNRVLSKKDFLEIGFHVPNLSEQEKIAEFLTAVDEKIELLQKRIELLKKYKKGVMQAIFSQKLRFRDENGRDFPDWENKKLGEIAEFLKGRSISKSDVAEDGSMPVILYGELYTRYKEVINEIHSNTNLSQKGLLFSRAGDVIIPASGETNLDIATASCVVKDGVGIGGDVNVVRTEQNGVFLAYYLSIYKKREIARLSQGNSVVHIYSSQLKKLAIVLPSLREQQKIADFLTSLDDKIKLEEGRLGQAKRFKKALLQQMFV